MHQLDHRVVARGELHQTGPVKCHEHRPDGRVAHGLDDRPVAQRLDGLGRGGGLRGRRRVHGVEHGARVAVQALQHVRHPQTDGVS